LVVRRRRARRCPDDRGSAMAADPLDDYERLICPARARFDANRVFAWFSQETRVDLVELFLVHYCALGVRMTEPVEGWIGRAAERCHQAGLTAVGTALRKHALAESGHHLMMMRDLDALVTRYNTRNPSHPLDGAAFHAIRPTPGVKRYIALHESNIAGATPFGQVAIEFEIELLPLRHGEQFVRRCMTVCGPDIMPCLSFVTEHVELDVGHTKLNAHLLSEVLAADPTRLGVSVARGTEALDAYAAFLEDCHFATEEWFRTAV
jgi:hypothetical protein